MIACPQCGSRNNDDEQFCGACGTYLEWDSAAPDAPPQPPTAQAPEPATAPWQADLAAAAADPAVTALEPTPPSPSAHRSQEDGAAVAPGPAPAEAAPTAEPPSPPTAAPRQPAAVRPGVPKPAPAPAPRAEDRPSPGDLVCGRCGAGNSTTRRFCRRCGSGLADAQVQARRSWWSRLWRPERLPGPVAGYRPTLRRRRVPTRTVVTVLVLGALVGLALTLRPEIERARIVVVDRIQGNVAVNPTAVVGSSELPERPAAQARDGATDLAWSPAAAGDGVGQFLDMPFAQPFRLTRVLIYSGASDVEKDYLAGSSPQVLTLTATTAAGTQEIVELPLADRVGLQTAPVGIDDVVAVRLLISSTYRATPQTFVAIAEVEFRGRP